MIFSARFKEKFHRGEDDWETCDGWSESIDAPNLRAALDAENKKCKEYEAKALERGEEIRVTCEIQVPLRQFRRL